MKRALLVAVGAGLVLGVVTRLVYELPGQWWWVAKIGSPWIAVAFATGLTARRPVLGALAGAGCLVTATLVYYAIMGLLQHAYDASPLGLGWLLVAVPVGLVFGTLGSAARRSELRTPAVATLCAAFAAEALLIGDRAGTGPGVLLVAALVAPFALGRSHRDQALAFGWTAALTIAAVGAGRVVLAVTGYA